MSQLTSKELRRIYNQLVKAGKPVETVGGIPVFKLRPDPKISPRNLVILQEILMS